MLSPLAEKLTWLDYTIVAYILYFCWSLAIVQVAKNTDETLFLANKSLDWYSIGFNMWGTNVGPSMLLAFASIGYSTGIVAVNLSGMPLYSCFC
jgi:SSS family solute:Na+ symporter